MKKLHFYISVFLLTLLTTSLVNTKTYATVSCGGQGPCGEGLRYCEGSMNCGGTTTSDSNCCADTASVECVPNLPGAQPPEIAVVRCTCTDGEPYFEFVENPADNAQIPINTQVNFRWKAFSGDCGGGEGDTRIDIYNATTGALEATSDWYLDVGNGEEVSYVFNANQVGNKRWVIRVRGPQGTNNSSDRFFNVFQPCTPVAPNVSLNTPANGATIPAGNAAYIDADINYGSSCPPITTQAHNLWIDGELEVVGQNGDTTVNYTFNCNAQNVGQHSWYVEVYNGTLPNTFWPSQTNPRTFTCAEPENQNSAPTVPARCDNSPNYNRWSNNTNIGMCIRSQDYESNLTNFYRTIQRQRLDGNWENHLTPYWSCSGSDLCSPLGPAMFKNATTTFTFGDGIYRNLAFARDGGNPPLFPQPMDSATSGPIGPYRVDTTVPDVTFDNLDPNTTYEGTVVIDIRSWDYWNPYNLGVRTPGSSGLSTVKLYANSILIATITTPNPGQTYAYPFDTTAYGEEGDPTLISLRFEATDNAGNIRNKFFDMTVLNLPQQPPAFNITAPQDGITLPEGTPSVVLSGRVNYNVDTTIGNCAQCSYSFQTSTSVSGPFQDLPAVSCTAIGPGLPGNQYHDVSCTWTQAFQPNTSYYYRMRASNPLVPAGQVSAPRRFTIAGSVVGKMFEASEACEPDNNRFGPGDVDDFNPRANYGNNLYDGTWNPGAYGSGAYDYQIPGVPNGNGVSIATDNPLYPTSEFAKYVITCYRTQGVVHTTSPTSAINVNISSDPASRIVDIGYSLSTPGWFTVINGSVYAKSLGFVIPTTVASGFNAALLQDTKVVLSNGATNVTDIDGEIAIEDTNNKYYTENLGTLEWPSVVVFLAPSNANEITSCNTGIWGGSLNPDNVYKIDDDCLNSAIATYTGQYNLSKDGVVVIYVEGSDAIVFKNNFQSQNANRRIMFVAEGSFTISKEVGESIPTPTSRANIEASLIAQDSINIETVNTEATTGKGEGESEGSGEIEIGGSEGSEELIGGETEGKEGTTVELTAILEGPLITKNGSINFNRNRLLENTYPSEIIRLNPLYIDKLLQQSKDANSNYHGLLKRTIRWEY